MICIPAHKVCESCLTIYDTFHICITASVGQVFAIYLVKKLTAIQTLGMYIEVKKGATSLFSKNTTFDTLHLEFKLAIYKILRVAKLPPENNGQYVYSESHNYYDYCSPSLVSTLYFGSVGCL